MREPICWLAFAIIFAWFVFYLLYWSPRKHRAEFKSINENWGSLARLNRLNFFHGGFHPRGGIIPPSKKPRVSGEYRGRPLVLTVLSEIVLSTVEYVSIAATTVTLQIDNPQGCFLVLHEKGILRKVLGWGKDHMEISDLDPRFVVDGRPVNFVERAQSILKLLIRKRRTLGVNQAPFVWTFRSKLPSIRLERSQLTWQQYDVVTDPSELSELFNLLSALADLAEETPVVAVAK